MGYCYQGNRLCCDICGAAGARKNKCPVGWCQPIACCPSPKCKAGLAKHRKDVCASSCKVRSAQFKAERQIESDMLAAGKAVRCSALGGANGMVHVLFRKADGTQEGRKSGPVDCFDAIKRRWVSEFELREGV